MNADRVANGLTVLRADSRLATLARDRATTLAELGVLSHTASGDLAAQLKERGIQWFMYGENVAKTGVPWGDPAAQQLYSLWKASPGHWSLMMSNRMNYAGVGMALRSVNNQTYSAIVFTEANDRTKPSAKITASSASGRTVTWSWKGSDPKLQTHTAGVRDYDVQYRRGDGAWSTIREDTTATKLSLTGRGTGRWHSIRVRTTDGRGNVGGWSPEARVWVP
jgi:hypothetical protein